MQLRPYQIDAVERVRTKLVEGASFVLFVLPTGGGKTVVASYIIARALELGSHQLFVAHRRELIKQTFCKLLRSGIPAHEVGVIMAGVPTAKAGELHLVDLGASDALLWERHARRRPSAKVQVASIDTLRRAPKPKADLVIVDEAHRALATSYKLLREWYPAPTVHLGLTATPCRGDGKGLGDAYEAMVEVASIRQLIDMGFLVEPKCWTVPAGSLPDLRAVKVTAGDYKLDELDRAVNQAGLVGDIVDHWKRRGRDARTVVFAVSIEHSKQIVERFRASGIAAEHLDGSTPTEERDAILARLERGETRVVSNCNVLCEGWDMPSVKTLVLARPTKSLGLCLQMAGRILRPWQSEPAVILDHAGCLVEHGLPQDEREWSLEKTTKARRSAKEDSAKLCPNPDCLAVLELGMRVCPECGAELPFRERKPPEETSGELIEATLRASLDQLAKWDALVVKWREENARRMATPGGRPRKPGWLFHEWKKKNRGQPPPKGHKRPTLTPDEQARLDAVDSKPKLVTIGRAEINAAEEADFQKQLASWDQLVSTAERAAASGRRVSW